MRPNKEQFDEYVRIKNSGMTNMTDIKFLTTISTTGLTEYICLYIMQHFVELTKEYGVI